MNESKVIQPLARTKALIFWWSRVRMPKDSKRDVPERVDGRVEVASEDPEPFHEQRHPGIRVV